MPDDPWLAKLNAFETRWMAALKGSAEVTFSKARIENAPSDPQVAADNFVASQGFGRIAPRWRVIEGRGCNQPSNLGSSIISGAVASNLVFPTHRWLEKDLADQLANNFIESFKATSRGILTNRIGDMWNPIGNATIEWAFVGYDNVKIALMLLQAED